MSGIYKGREFNTNDKNTLYDTSTNLQSNSANWINTRTVVNANSANWVNTRTVVNANSANWVNTTTVVRANSATTWNYQGTDLKGLSANWQNTFTVVNSTSALWMNAGSGIFVDGITVGDGTSAVGIKIDTNNPSYGWRDITGVITWDYGGADAPVIADFRTPVRAFYLDTNDNVDSSFHIPHDYVPGSDLFLHFHWSHDASTITGPLSCVFSTTYARRSNGTDYIFPVAKKHYVTYETVNIATTPAYSHRVDEVQITSLTDTATSYAASSIEVDGVILVDTLFAVIPTMSGGTSGGTPNRIPLLHVDLHYQSNNLGTKNKAFPFFL